jgi:FtsP/CotA-like multicopper oxidase with cupredoxin domain
MLRRRAGGDSDWVDETLGHWRDTITLLPEEHLQFAALYDGFAGGLLYRCHIFEHGGAGMMGVLNVD